MTENFFNTRFVILASLLSAVGVNGIPTNGYTVNEGAGKEYKLVYQSRTWSSAEETCKRDGAKLAVPKSKEEFEFIQRLVRGMYYPAITGTSYKFVVWVGINNLENYKVWKNVEGENIENSGYYTFSGDNGKGYSDNPAEPHCVAIDPANPGLRDWWCHHQQPINLCVTSDKNTLVLLTFVSDYLGINVIWVCSCPRQVQPGQNIRQLKESEGKE
ncbi:unnamed protein product [Arctia plantaginis]|uniref:C-type lectin domain-containing protein n=1 Tax=Arctia plantaginis TaxID=874455 RepID=A0A8S0Z7S1_ARCPL|nr:unnamed protein product [Arctia plantaginis]CAB3228195.1 unnamed protein product [Arctia plantaginis]